ncbi:hypothetical protein ACFO0N_01750 [Halobium salinum]|uniref:Uncharacterized protein n=1 Tax=Halobium salinum TaxID=1364940 RepID=A0ABD5P7K6_9EURY|nr:hypothetical protein [Halobium salinum]
MTPTSDRSRWRPQRLSAALSGPLTLLSAGVYLYGVGRVDWLFVAVGAAVTLVSGTVLARSTLGRYLQSGFERIGVVGRVAVIAVVAVAVWTALFALEPPVVPALSLVAGATSALLLVELSRLLTAEDSPVE